MVVPNCRAVLRAFLYTSSVCVCSFVLLYNPLPFPFLPMGLRSHWIAPSPSNSCMCVPILQETPLSRVDRAFLPVVCYLLFSRSLFCSYLQSSLTVAVLYRLVRCSLVSRNRCISMHPSTMFVWESDLGCAHNAKPCQLCLSLKVSERLLRHDGIRVQDKREGGNSA